MKKLLLGSAALVAFTNFAHASVVFNGSVGNGLYLTLSDTLPTSTYAPTTPLAQNTLQGAQGDQFVNGSIIAKSPFADNSKSYDAVLGGGTATFGIASDFVALFALPTSSASFTNAFGSGTGTFSFVWGTPDTYNSLSFVTNSGVKSFDGSVLGGIANGGGSYFATVSGLGDYSSTTFASNQNAFEFAAVSAVPLPASAPMFGAALLALAGFGYSINRWVAPKGKATV